MSSKDWRSGSSSSGDESFSPSEKRGTGRKLAFDVQEDISESAASELTGYAVVKVEDAQSVYPPSCCVFVAK